MPLQINITRAGLNPSDDWTRACGRALLRAFINGFDEYKHADNDKRNHDWLTRFEQKGGEPY